MPSSRPHRLGVEPSARGRDRGTITLLDLPPSFETIVTGINDASDLVGEQHFRFTGSERAKALLADWATARRKFVKVFPTEYKRALGEMYAKEQEAKGSDREAIAA